MFKKLVSTFAIAGLMLAITPVLAKPNLTSTVAEVASSTKGPAVQVVIPSHAIEVAPNIYNIGYSVDVDGTILQGYAIIHPKAKPAKPANPGNGGGGSTTSTCYAFLAKGAKWKNVEGYNFAPDNTAGLATSEISTILANSLQKWNVAAGTAIFGTQVGNDVNVAAIGNSTNGVNEVVFGSINSPGAIAVTYAWGVFGGPISGRYLAEWDMIFDQEDFSWNIDGNSLDMDFENITTHEIGHAAGMGHPTDTCVNETMYRYASEGEIKKRDLNIGDIAGIQALY